MEPHLPDHSLTGDGPAAGSRGAARIGLYVHVPFCARRCSYCDFATGPLSAAAVERYLSALELEAARREETAAAASFSSVFVGGGTPSSLSARHFGRLWKTLTDHFTLAPGAEITLEANPESVRPALLEAWAEAGVNRLSMGAQSFDRQELSWLGRIHDAERPGQAVELARRHGFRRLSLDLMFGFPGNRLESWRQTLETALALGTEHLSAYCFIPEEDTPLGRSALAGETPLPAPEVQADLYDWLTERLGAAGFGLYETANFCRPGAECRHNLVYWLRRDYLALGPSAHGLWAGARYANHRERELWAEALERGEPCDASEPSTAESQADEILLLALRLGSGLEPEDHPAAAWRGVLERYGAALERGVATGRLVRTASGYRIPPRHRFVADDVIAWLLATPARAAIAA